MNKRKIVSLLLALVMVFSVFPIQTLYAWTLHAPGEGGSVSDDKLSDTVGGWSFEPKRYNGMRFSLYFIEDVNSIWKTFDDYQKSEANKYEDGKEGFNQDYIIANTIQIGSTLDTVYYNDNNVYLPTHSSFYTVYDRMTMNQMPGILEDFVYFSDYSSRTKSLKKDFNFTKSFPDIFEKNAEKSKWTDFFVGTDQQYFKEKGTTSVITQEDWDNTDVSNVMAVIDVILESSNGIYKISKDDFKQGVLHQVQADGTTVDKHGVYKFYYEPIVSFQYSPTKRYAVTTRDLIALNSLWKDKTFKGKSNGKEVSWSFSTAITTGSKDLGNAVYLNAPEPLLGMDGSSSGISSNNGLKLDTTYANAAGVGVVTGCPHGTFDNSSKYPSIVKLYSIADGVDENGNLKLKPFMVDGKQYKEVITGEQIQDCYYTNELKALAVNY